MIDLNIHQQIEDIEQDWRATFKKNPNLTPFQSYDWNKLLQIKYKDSVSRRLCFQVCFVTALDHTGLIIAPLSIHKWKKELYVLGQQEMSDYLDFIYPPDISEEFFVKFILELRNKFKGYTFFFDRVREDGMTNIFLKKVPDCKFVEMKPCYGIPVAVSGERYFSSLGRSTKRIIRQSWKRLGHDGRKYEVDINHGCLSKETVDEMLQVYRLRHESENKLSLARKCLIGLKRMIKTQSFDVLSAWLMSDPDSFSAIARIDQEMAAFCAGFADKKKNLYICRVAMNPKFAWYRPGILLVSKTMEILSDQQDVHNKWKYFDLTRGNERYKIQLGGELHYNNLYQIGGE